MILAQRPDDFAPWFEVAACLCECDGKLLLLKRLEGKSEGGKWGAPGGKMDEGETILEALAREVFEETGVRIEDPSRLTIVQEFFVRTEKKDFVYHLYRHSFDAEPEVSLNPHEHTEAQWIGAKEALEMELVADMEECLRVAYGM